MFGELKPLMDAAQKFLAETINDQIEDCQTAIATQQRKIKRLKAKRAFFDKFAKEMAKPPKPFVPIKLTKAQRKAYNRAVAGIPGAGPAFPTSPAVGQ